MDSKKEKPAHVLWPSKGPDWPEKLRQIRNRRAQSAEKQRLKMDRAKALAEQKEVARKRKEEKREARQKKQEKKVQNKIEKEASKAKTSEAKTKAKAKAEAARKRGRIGDECGDELPSDSEIE